MLLNSFRCSFVSKIAPNKTFKIKNISFEDKSKILDRLNGGERISAITKSLNLNEATVRTIKRSEVKIRHNIAEGSSKIAKRTARTRDIDLVKMEKALFIWIEDCESKYIYIKYIKRERRRLPRVRGLWMDTSLIKRRLKLLNI